MWFFSKSVISEWWFLYQLLKCCRAFAEFSCIFMLISWTQVRLNSEIIESCNLQQWQNILFSIPLNVSIIAGATVCGLCSPGSYSTSTGGDADTSKCKLEKVGEMGKWRIRGESAGDSKFGLKLRTCICSLTSLGLCGHSAHHFDVEWSSLKWRAEWP